MKLGRTFPTVRRAMERSGRLPEAHYVERATMSGERTERLADIDAETVPYFSVSVVPSRIADLPPATAASPDGPGEVAASAACPGEVVVVGTGPAGPLWLTPESRGALAAAEDLVGYTTYLDRVPLRPGQRRHASDNKVESERAELALDLARRGRRVAVVSGGDPGVFAMATAVLEVACQSPYRAIPVRVLPGVTAANAAAARAGAPSATTTRSSPSPTASSPGRSSPNACMPRQAPTWPSPCTTPAPAAAPGRSARPANSSWNTAPPTPPSSSPATSAAPRNPSARSTWPTSTRTRSTCGRC